VKFPLVTIKKTPEAARTKQIPSRMVKGRFSVNDSQHAQISGTSVRTMAAVPALEAATESMKVSWETRINKPATKIPTVVLAFRSGEIMFLPKTTRSMISRIKPAKTRRIDTKSSGVNEHCWKRYCAHTPIEPQKTAAAIASPMPLLKDESRMSFLNTLEKEKTHKGAF